MPLQFTHKSGGDAPQPYHFTESGLDNVYLTNGFKRVQTKYGEAVSFMHADELLNVIGEALAVSKRDLTGKELRFLRHRLNITQSELGQFLGVDHQTIGRWERDEIKATESAVKLLRMFYLEELALEAANSMTLRQLFDRLDQFDEDTDASFCMSISDNEVWDASKIPEAA